MKFTDIPGEIIPFGQYKGELLADIPNDYLVWLYNNLDKKHFFKNSLLREINRRKIDLEDWDGPESEEERWYNS